MNIIFQSNGGGPAVAYMNGHGVVANGGVGYNHHGNGTIPVTNCNGKARGSPANSTGTGGGGPTPRPNRRAVPKPGQNGGNNWLANFLFSTAAKKQKKGGGGGSPDGTSMVGVGTLMSNGIGTVGNGTTIPNSIPAAAAVVPNGDVDYKTSFLVRFCRLKQLFCDSVEIH